MTRRQRELIDATDKELDKLLFYNECCSKSPKVSKTIYKMKVMLEKLGDEL